MTFNCKGITHTYTRACTHSSLHRSLTVQVSFTFCCCRSLSSLEQQQSNGPTRSKKVKQRKATGVCQLHFFASCPSVSYGNNLKLDLTFCVAFKHTLDQGRGQEEDTRQEQATKGSSLDQGSIQQAPSQVCKGMVPCRLATPHRFGHCCESVTPSSARCAEPGGRGAQGWRACGRRRRRWRRRWRRCWWRSWRSCTVGLCWNTWQGQGQGQGAEAEHEPADSAQAAGRRRGRRQHTS